MPVIGAITLLAAVFLLFAGIKIILSTVLRYNPSSFGLLCTALLWLIGIAGTHLWPNEAARHSSMLLQYVAISWLAPFLVTLTLGFSQNPSPWRKHILLILCSFSLLVSFVVLGFPLEGLIITDVRFDYVTGNVYKTLGPLYAAYVLYQGIAALVSLGILFKRSTVQVREEKARACTLFASFLPPIVIALSDAAGFRPLPGQSLTPYALLLSAIIIFWGMHKTKLLSPVFLAKENLIETMAEPVIVSQRNGRILFANKQAELIAQNVAKTPENMSRFQFLGNMYANAESGEETFITCIDTSWRCHSYFLNKSDPCNSPIITVLHDVSIMTAQAQYLELLVQERTSELQSLLQQKEQLLHELHHRVKNNLQIIISLIRMQSSRVHDNTDMHSVFNSMVERVKSISFVHDLMNRQAKLDDIDFGFYLEGLIKNMTNSYDSVLPAPVLDIPQNVLMANMDSCVDFGLVINELMTNAYKYALPMSKKALDIQLVITDNKMRIIIRDYGPGFNESNHRKENLGLTIVKGILKKYSAVLENGFEGGAWVSVIVQLPVFGLYYKTNTNRENSNGTSDFSS